MMAAAASATPDPLATTYTQSRATATQIVILMHPWAAATSPQKGDLNGDDQIRLQTPRVALELADAAIALQLAATGGRDPAADVGGDSRITSLDALMILQAAAGGWSCAEMFMYHNSIKDTRSAAGIT